MRKYDNLLPFKLRGGHKVIPINRSLIEQQIKANGGLVTPEGATNNMEDNRIILLIKSLKKLSDGLDVLEQLKRQEASEVQEKFKDILIEALGVHGANPVIITKTTSPNLLEAQRLYADLMRRATEL